MNSYCADLHIHSVLSPCGDLEMSPGRIVEEAVQKGIEIIAITDHNHTGHAKLVRRLGSERGLWVVFGAEINTREEVHCLTFFDTEKQLDEFQAELERNLPRIPNNKDIFGFQVVVDEKEQVISEVEHSLYPGLNWGISEAAGVVHELGGLFVPAHINRPMNGLLAQLGFLPEDLEIDAVETTWNCNQEELLLSQPELSAYQLFTSSDAHYVEDIGRGVSELFMKERNFFELGLALRGEQGRQVIKR